MSSSIQTIRQPLAVSYSVWEKKVVDLFVKKGEVIVLIPFALGVSFCLIDVFRDHIKLLPFGITFMILSFTLILIWGLILYFHTDKTPGEPLV